MSSTYTQPVGATNDTIYADACGWDPDPTSATSKLTTVLADLVRSSGSATTLSAESARPASVNDAMRSRRLRIDANNDVQVYEVAQGPSAAELSQLTAYSKSCFASATFPIVSINVPRPL